MSFIKFYSRLFWLIYFISSIPIIFNFNNYYLWLHLIGLFLYSLSCFRFMWLIKEGLKSFLSLKSYEASSHVVSDGCFHSRARFLNDPYKQMQANGFCFMGIGDIYIKKKGNSLSPLSFKLSLHILQETIYTCKMRTRVAYSPGVAFPACTCRTLIPYAVSPPSSFAHCHSKKN